MDALFESIGKLLGVFKDPVNVLMLLVIFGEAWFIQLLRREGREDRKEMLAALQANTSALNAVRTSIAVLSGKVE